MWICLPKLWALKCTSESLTVWKMKLSCSHHSPQVFSHSAAILVFLNTQQVFQSSGHLFCLGVHADVAKGYTIPSPPSPSFFFFWWRVPRSMTQCWVIVKMMGWVLCQIIPVIHDSSFGGLNPPFSVSVVTTISPITQYLVLAPLSWQRCSRDRKVDWWGEPWSLLFAQGKGAAQIWVWKI